MFSEHVDSLYCDSSPELGEEGVTVASGGRELRVVQLRGATAGRLGVIVARYVLLFVMVGIGVVVAVVVMVVQLKSTTTRWLGSPWQNFWGLF